MVESQEVQFPYFNSANFKYLLFTMGGHPSLGLEQVLLLRCRQSQAFVVGSNLRLFLWSKGGNQREGNHHGTCLLILRAWLFVVHLPKSLVPTL